MDTQVDWTLVADNMDITNGHAARMRFARYKNQVEGVQPRPREPRAPGSSSKNSRGRPVKKQKVEQGKKEEDDVKQEKGERGNNSGEGRKIKSEGGEEGMPQAKMTEGGALGPGAGIKREFDDVDADGEVDEMAENHMDLTWNASRGEKSPSRNGSKTEMALRIKREPGDGVEDRSLKRINFSKSTAGGEEGADAPADSISQTDLSATTPSQPVSASAPANKASTSQQTSPHTTSPPLHIPPLDQAISPTLTFNATTIPSMQHLHLNQPPPNQRLFSNDMSMHQTHTPPSSNGEQQGYISPVPSYHTYQGQSPPTTSSAPYSLPPSPVGGGGGYNEMNRYGGIAQNGMGVGGGGYDMGVHNGIMMNQGSFVGMLQDPSFPNTYGSGEGGGYTGVGGWEGMYQ